MLRGFLDNCVIRNSQRVRVEFQDVLETINWGENEFELPVQRARERYSNEKFRDENPDAFRDCQSIGRLERLARWKLVTLFWHFELRWEFMAKRKSNRGGVSIVDCLEEANSPLFYGRMVAGALARTDCQFEFVKQLSHPRFDEWKRAAGVIVNSKREKNQLLDAFHLWTAEHNWCDYFVTMDYALIETVRVSGIRTGLRLVTPRQFECVAWTHAPAAICERVARGLIHLL